MNLLLETCFYVISIALSVGVFASVFPAKRCKDNLLAVILGSCGVLIFATALLTWHADIYFAALRPLLFGVIPFLVHCDALSSIFLALLGFLCIAVSLFSPGYLSCLKDEANSTHYWCALFLFVLSMFFVLLSANAISFVVFWEVMSLSSVALVSCHHQQHRVRQAASVYLGATRIATAFLSVGFLCMYSISHSWNFSDWHFTDNQTYLAALLILLGFLVKAGIWPFHIWLPYAHPAAPAPVSSLMSGIMIKVALYGIVRILVLGNLHCLPIAYLALFLGAVSSFWGVLFALVQRDLKTLLAYSSVENAGLILMGIAICLYGMSASLPNVAAIALLAALLHCINHGVFKALLFLSAGSVDAATHTRDLVNLGGLAKNMPHTTAAFLIGSAAICSLPPLSGFTSKWFLYQSLLHAAWQSQGLIERSAAIALVGTLAVVGGLALAVFTKAVGITFLGEARSSAAGHAKESSDGIAYALAMLVCACVVLCLAIPYLLDSLASICKLAVPAAALAPEFFIIPQTTIALVLFVLFCLIYALFLSSKVVPIRRYITWECGFGALSSRAEATADSFAQPLARIFSPLFKYKLDVRITGKEKRHFPEDIRVEVKTVSMLESTLYRPALAGFAGIAKRFAKFQAGSIHLYLLYVCITLVLLLLVGTQI